MKFQTHGQLRLEDFKIWTKPGLFLIYFRPFLSTMPNIVKIDHKSVEVVLGIQTQDCKMVQTNPQIYGGPFRLDNFK